MGREGIGQGRKPGKVSGPGAFGRPDPGAGLGHERPGRSQPTKKTTVHADHADVSKRLPQTGEGVRFGRESDVQTVQGERMAKIVAYLRVSTDAQDMQGQRLEILDRANREGLQVNDWVSFEISSRRSLDERGITGLLASLDPGDMLIVAELSRLGRSLGQVIEIVNRLIEGRVRLWSIKDGIRLDGSGEMDLATKTMVAMFGLMAEIERDLISQRTKAGLAAARAKGKVLGGRPGLRASKLDPRREEIEGYLAKGVSQASIAKLVDVAPTTLQGWLVSRGLR